MVDHERNLLDTDVTSSTELVPPPPPLPPVTWRGVECVDSGAWPRWRWMRASEPLPAGHVACESEAFAVVVTEEWKRRVCSQCFTVCSSRLSVKCDACGECYYCDEGCRDRHAGEHAAVCAALERFSSLKKVGKETMAVLRLLLHALAREHAPAASAVSEQPPTFAPALGPLASFGDLQHHPAAFDSAKEAHDWSKAASLFRGVLSACPWYPWRPRTGSHPPAEPPPPTGAADAAPPPPPLALPPPPPPSDDELFALVSRIDSNVFGVFSRDGQARVSQGRNVDLIGHGVYLAASLFNHSCEPTCHASTGVRRMSVVVDEGLEAGIELTIAYCDVHQPLAARRRLLRQHYRFECACSRCESEAAGETKPKLSYGGGGGGPPKSQLSKREKRERREQRATSHAAPPAGTPASAVARQVRVAVDLRVLLKLAKAEPPSATAAKPAGGKHHPHPPRRKPPAPVQIPVCCVRLRLLADDGDKVKDG